MAMQGSEPTCEAWKCLPEGQVGIVGDVGGQVGQATYRARTWARVEGPGNGEHGRLHG